MLSTRHALVTADDVVAVPRRPAGLVGDGVLPAGALLAEPVAIGRRREQDLLDLRATRAAPVVDADHVPVPGGQRLPVRARGLEASSRGAEDDLVDGGLCREAPLRVSSTRIWEKTSTLVSLGCSFTR